MELNKAMILLNQTIESKEQAIELAGKVLVDNGMATADYIESMFERDRLVSTYMGNHIAIPHGTDEGRQFVKATGISVIQVPSGVDFSDEGNGEKVAKLIFGIAAVGDEHLELLSNIAIICSEEANVQRLVNAETEEEIIEILKEA